MSGSGRSLAGDLRSFDRRVRDLVIEPRGPHEVRRQLEEPALALTAAMSAAALSGGLKAVRCESSTPLETRKKDVDGAATRAAEAVFSNAALDIRVAAGEGERDESPGAVVGQHLGAGSRAARSGGTLSGVFDYVDGTTLAATNAPGALALGSLGLGFRPVPDQQAYVVLGPQAALGDLDISSPPEEHALTVLAAIARHESRELNDLTVFTHSLSSNQMHRTLIGLLRDHVATVLVPESVTVEPPYLLSLAGMTQPRLDAMIGAIGLSELAFSATLLDLISPGHGFLFRVGSLAGPRRAPQETTLRPLFDFSDAELRVFARAGLDVGRQYSSHDLVRQGSTLAAAIFAVTDVPELGLAAPFIAADGARTEGLLLEPHGLISRVSVLYDGSASVDGTDGR